MSNGGSGSGPEAGASDAAAVDPAALAQEAFVWGYPLVVTQRTLQFLGGLVGVNTLFNQTAISDASLRVIVAPNQDTLYSIAVMDLRSEPLVLTVPDVMDRYWTYQFLDGWTESFHYIGTRATGGRGGTFLIAPPGWDGEVPPGAERIDAPTPQLFLLGRFLVRGDADVASVVALERRLVPLSTYLGTAPPDPPPPLGDAPGAPAETGQSGAAFFDELGDALAVNGPASSADRAALSRFEAIGIGPGAHPTEAADAARRALLEQAVTDGLASLADTAGAQPSENGWSVRYDLGQYGDDVMLRALVARIGWGANVPEEAVYPISRLDADGAPYDGTQSYVLHLDADALPPVDPTLGFWSLTLYAADMFFYDNPEARYSLRPETGALEYGADGSIDLLVGPTAPSTHAANWLPSPPGPFVLMLRMYLPDARVLSGGYSVPGVTRVP